MASGVTSPVPWMTRVDFGGRVVVVGPGNVVVVEGGTVVVVMIVEVVDGAACGRVATVSSSSDAHTAKEVAPSRAPRTRTVRILNDDDTMG